MDGNSIKVPVTQAQVAVDCKIGGSDLVYSTIVRVFVNTQTFYTTLVSNQKMFKQTFTELSNSLDEQGVKLEKYYSEFQQTARGLSATISSNKQDADGSIENITNKLEATSSSLSSTIEANKKDADGNFEKLKTEFKQTTDGITSTVEKNKTDADGKLEKLSAAVTMNANQIEIANSRFNADGTLKNKSGLMTTDDKATLATREYVDGKVVSEAYIRTMIQNGISTAEISADQINLYGHTMSFQSGQIEIYSDNLKLDSSGNLKVSGDIYAKTIRLKTSTSHDNILSGSLLLGGGKCILPALSEEDGCVNIKLYAPLITRSSLPPTLECISGNVFLQLASEKTELPKSGSKELEYGAYDLIGFCNSGQTFWIIK